MLHCVIFFLMIGCPPRSDTPFTISSFAKTVPNAGHQFTSASAKYVNLYCNKICCCFMESNPAQSSAENVSTLSSQTAFTFEFPSEAKMLVSLEISSAFSASLSYQELNN